MLKTLLAKTDVRRYIIEAKLVVELSLASIRQKPSILNFDVEVRMLLSRTNKVAQELTKIDDLVHMATDVGGQAKGIT